MHHLVQKVLLGIALILGMATASQAQTISTLSSWDGTNDITSFGVPNTATFGQTVIVPAGAQVLSGFSFQVSIFSGGPITARGLVYAWDATNQRATGTALFTSAPVAISSTSFAPLNFSITPPITVTSGQQLVIFATTSLDQPQAESASAWGSVNGMVYPNGEFVYQSNGTDTAQWTGQAWSNFSFADLAFTARFDAAQTAATIPTLSEWMLIWLMNALAMAGLIQIYRRRT